MDLNRNGNAMAGVDSDNGLPCLRGECSCVVRDRFPNFVGSAAHLRAPDALRFSFRFKHGVAGGDAHEANG
jgi:hypothetical protein